MNTQSGVPTLDPRAWWFSYAHDVRCACLVHVDTHVRVGCVDVFYFKRKEGASTMGIRIWHLGKMQPSHPGDFPFLSVACAAETKQRQ